MRFLLYLPFMMLCAGRLSCYAQTSVPDTSMIQIDLELRPRVEFRNHFKFQPSDSLARELLMIQRNRLSFTVETPRIRFHASPQEIHVWGGPGTFSQVGSINLFELYLQPYLTRYLSVKVGRQALTLDNGRLFSAAPWAQQSRAHEGARIVYEKNQLTTDFTAAFARPYGKRFDPRYSPVSSHQYKLLLIHHLQYRINERFRILTIGAVDVFESPAGTEVGHYQRWTAGGRFEYDCKDIYTTVAGYFQTGQTSELQRINAFYLQPELQVKAGKMASRLGAEILSGNKKTGSDVKYYRSFVPLYGVAWKFMGNMNFFTRFPVDVGQSGLINPYLFLTNRIGKKISIRADFHLFYSMYALLNASKQEARKYLGFENDLSVNFKLGQKWELNYGFAYSSTEKGMELLGKVNDSTRRPVWSYLMVSYHPKLLSKRVKFKH